MSEQSRPTAEEDKCVHGYPADTCNVCSYEWLNDQLHDRDAEVERLKSEIEALKKERDDLRADCDFWIKQHHDCVDMNKIDALKRLEKTAALRAEVERLKAFEEDITEQHRAVMEERCSPEGEMHCTCVPAYKRTVAALRAEVEKLKRHWIEDDRDITELEKENNALRAKVERLEANAIGFDGHCPLTNSGKHIPEQCVRCLGEETKSLRAENERLKKKLEDA